MINGNVVRMRPSHTSYSHAPSGQNCHRFGQLPYSVGGYSERDDKIEIDKWQPDMTAVKSTIELTRSTKRLDDFWTNIDGAEDSCGDDEVAVAIGNNPYVV